MAATKTVVVQGRNRMILNVRGDFTGTDSGADLTDDNILNISDFIAPSGGAPSKVRIDEIWWTVNGYNYVKIEFDRTTDVVAHQYAGQGYMNYKEYGGIQDTGTGNTGDLFLTTSGGAAGGSYNFIISLKLKD